MAPTEPTSQPSRRKFLSNSSTALVGGALATSLAPPAVHAAGDDTLKIGLIGCGGRGNSAAGNAMRGDPNVKLTAMADAFEDRLDQARKVLSRSLREKYAVDDDHAFSGFDAYKKVMNRMSISSCFALHHTFGRSNCAQQSNMASMYSARNRARLMVRVFATYSKQ